MKLELIHQNLWWPTNRWERGDLVSGVQAHTVQRMVGYFDKGAICFNGDLSTVIVGKEQIIRNTAPPSTRQLDFILDADKIHLENMYPAKTIKRTNGLDDDFVFNTNPLWNPPIGIRLTGSPHSLARCPTLSLRIAGYLVDCWEIYGSVYIEKDHVLFHNCEFIHTMPKIEARFSIGGSTIIANFPNPSSDYRIGFEYQHPSEVHPLDCVNYFSKHHRNFFLSFAR